MFKLPVRKSTTVRTVELGLRNDYTEAEIASMARLGTLVHFEAGDTLMAEGEDGTHAFLIANGSAAVHRGGESVASLRSGHLVGEGALLTGNPRSATVTAMRRVTALRFDRTQFGWLRLEWLRLKTMTNELIAARA